MNKRRARSSIKSCVICRIEYKNANRLLFFLSWENPHQLPYPAQYIVATRRSTFDRAENKRIGVAPLKRSNLSGRPSRDTASLKRIHQFSLPRDSLKINQRKVIIDAVTVKKKEAKRIASRRKGKAKNRNNNNHNTGSSENHYVRR